MRREQWCDELRGIVRAAGAASGVRSQHDSVPPYVDGVGMRRAVAAMALDGYRPLHRQPSRQAGEARLRLGESLTRPEHQALAEIRANAGTQFCRTVVATLDRLAREEPEILGTIPVWAVNVA